MLGGRNVFASSSRNLNSEDCKGGVSAGLGFQGLTANGGQLNDIFYVTG